MFVSNDSKYLPQFLDFSLMTWDGYASDGGGEGDGVGGGESRQEEGWRVSDRFLTKFEYMCI